MESMLNVSVSQFTELLASKTSVPGGGGACALVASIGISLGDMVGEFTVGKKKYADVEADILKLMEEAQTLRVQLLACIDKDAQAFEPLSKAYGIPKEAPGRDAQLEQCLRDAAAAPYEIMELTDRALAILDAFNAKGSKLMLSDAVTGIALCKAALKGAAVNVKVNTKLMQERAYADALDAKVDAMLSKHGVQ